MVFDGLLRRGNAGVTDGNYFKRWRALEVGEMDMCCPETGCEVSYADSETDNCDASWGRHIVLTVDRVDCLVVVVFVVLDCMKKLVLDEVN